MTQIQEPKFIFNQGQAVRHKITGFRGHIQCRIEFLTGCNQYTIRGEKFKKDTTEYLEVQVDENLIEADPSGKDLLLEGTNTPQPELKKKDRPGGPVVKVCSQYKKISG